MRATVERRRSVRGLSLLEVLVALAIVATLGTALFSLTAGTLRFTGLTRAVSVSLEDVSDTEGYLNDVLRYAREVYGLLTVTVDGSSLTCDLTSGQCVAVAIPVVAATEAANITNFDLVILNVEQIGDLYVADGLARGWAGEETLALVEYRIERLCDTVLDADGNIDVERCATLLDPSDLPTTTVVNEPGILLTGLDDLAGTITGGIDFFSQLSPGVLEVTLAVRAGSGRNETPILQQSSVALQVVVRDVFDPTAGE